MLTRILTVAIALLAAYAFYERNQVSVLSAQLADARTQAVVQARASVVESMGSQTADVLRAMVWLHDYYKSADGLQRPEGLWLMGHPDFEGISAWIFSVYLPGRLKGQTDEEARQAVVDLIQRSDEWRTKHPAAR
jgi:hypothetical protein